jgi:hypothetical protein
MRAWCDRGIWRVVRGSGLTGVATSSLRTGGGDRIASTRGFRAGRSADGAGSEADGSTGCRFGVKSASAAWRALAVRSRSSPRGWCCCRWLGKSCPDCVATPEIEVEFVNFGKLLPQMMDCPFHVKSDGAANSGKRGRCGLRPACPPAAPFLSSLLLRSHGSFNRLTTLPCTSTVRKVSSSRPTISPPSAEKAKS